ncbi:V-type ATPase 116kDa subunit [Popillia japonica]|uniref:V-type proton ATPase subunit a n=1 Tax=Popillia japonica TaxID=7064 RepID=A0AAW1LTI4_POPJA
MFRSEEMALAQLFIQPEAAYQSISELGETGTVQFRDLNEEVNAFQRKFVTEVRRCDEMERKLRYIEAEVRKDGVHIPDVRELPKAPNPREITDLEAHLEKTEGEIKELSENAVSLKSNYLGFVELRQVLEKTHAFLVEQGEINGPDVSHKLPEDAQTAGIARGRLGFVAGVINRERIPAFERMLWRISRGNVFLKQAEIEEALEDPSTGNLMNKTVFVAFYQGEQLKSRINKVCGEQLKSRINKVCAGFHASIYSCPNISQEREEMLKNVRTQIEDVTLVLNQTKDHRQRVLVGVAKELQNWTVMVRKMKAIYHTLNMFNMDVTKKCLIGECWVPVTDIPVVQKALSDGSSAGGSSITSFLNVIETNENPPTFNRTNKFTRGFQNLIDSYGVASYREVNPALYTIITFPFLFAIMFGDAGHGVILFLFGLYMVADEKKYMAKKTSSEIWNIFFAGRYIVLLMGIFSIYTGFVYNDVFSKTMNIFGSSWNANSTYTDVDAHQEVQLNPSFDYAGTPYFIGVDPAWMLASNKIIFLNSFKMKLSIIFGVFHMIFGVCMSVVNYAHFRHIEDFFLLFLPQIIFLCLLFLWMVVMMFMKWIMYSADLSEMAYGSSCAPSVLIYFINMMLFSTNDHDEDCMEYMFEGQGTIQLIFVLVALLCIPVMLLGKPFYVMSTRKSQKKASGANGDVNQGMELQPESVSDIPQSAPRRDQHEEHEEPISEIFIHSAIHTIEYVLSTISHTASYLRLWALSLAHAQLSEVLWTMVLQMGFRDNYIGAIFLFLIFAAWAALTVAILVMMEGLSAFLHTLRLHWVEFMSKFYKGEGYIFQPFSFKVILQEEDEAD